jgi:hypothetical protein
MTSVSISGMVALWRLKIAGLTLQNLIPLRTCTTMAAHQVSSSRVRS